MAIVPHATSGLGLWKFQTDGFLLTRVYNNSALRISAYLRWIMKVSERSVTCTPHSRIWHTDEHLCPLTQWILGRKEDGSISEECCFWACHNDFGEYSRPHVYWQSVRSVSEDLATSVFRNKQPVRSVSYARRLIQWRRHGQRRTPGAENFHTCRILSLFWVYRDWICFWQKIVFWIRLLRSGCNFNGI